MNTLEIQDLELVTFEKINEIVLINNFVDTNQKIYQTTDYEKFNIKTDNRNIDYKKVINLIQSFKTNGVLMVPAIVNQDLEIIDGQNRWTALKQLAETDGIREPFYFIIQPEYKSEQMIVINNNSTNWNKKDYLKYHITNDNKNYIIFDQFLKDFPWLASTTAESIFTGRIDGVNHKRQRILVNTSNSEDLNEFIKSRASKNHKKDIGREKTFQNGGLKPDDLNLVYERAKQIESFSKFYPDFKNTNFVKAYLHVKNVKGFTYEELYSQFEKVYSNVRNERFKIANAHTINDFRDSLNDIFNYKKGEHDCINLRTVKR
jgi:hypothetical protein